MESHRGEWGFKSLKQIVKLQFKLGDLCKMLESYRKLLTYTRAAVTRNYSEKVINSILDVVSVSSDFELLKEFYATTLSFLEGDKNERLWFKTNLKLCKLWFAMKEFCQADKILKTLHDKCLLRDGSADIRKGTQLLEVYAIQIEMCTELQNNRKLKEYYKKALAITSAIPHPHILGIIRESGGKMHMIERQWKYAAIDFFEAFKSYDEAGHPRRIQCLKYLVLANMLMESDVNPFDAQEARPFCTNPEIVAILSLIDAYQRDSIGEFEDLLRQHRQQAGQDAFIWYYLEDLLANIRTQVLVKIIKPYTQIRIPFVSQELSISGLEVEFLLVSLILDGRITAQINQVTKNVGLGVQKHDSLKLISHSWEKLASLLTLRARHASMVIV